MLGRREQRERERKRATANCQKFDFFLAAGKAAHFAVCQNANYKQLMECSTKNQYSLNHKPRSIILIWVCDLVNGSKVTCVLRVNKSMHTVLEQGSIDNPLIFDIILLQLIFHTSVFN